MAEETMESGEVSAETSGETPNTEQSSAEQPVEQVSAEPDWGRLNADDEGRAEPFPSDESVEKAAPEEEAKSEDSPEVEAKAEAEVDDEDDEELDTLNETLTDDERKEVNLPKPARRKLRALEKLEKQVLNPFRDPDTPITEAWEALQGFMPTRASELASEIAKASITAYPDEWLSALVGQEGVTVQSVKEALSGKQSGETSESPAVEVSSDIPSLIDRPEVKELVDYLDETYQDDWRDPSKDDDLLSDDRLAVKSLRAQLSQENALKQQLEAAKKEIDSLKPEVDSIKEAQQTEYEKRLEAQVTEVTSDYKGQVEQRALPKVFQDLGLEPTESDTDQVRAVKGILKSKFEAQDGYISDFEMFAQTRFSEKDNLGKIIRRVAQNLGDSVQKTIEAQTARDKATADKLKAEAARLKELAQDEQDTIAVLTNRAAREFVSSEYQPVLELLNEIAELKRAASRGQREEVIGTTASSGTSREEILERVGKAENPFEEFARLNRSV